MHLTVDASVAMSLGIPAHPYQNAFLITLEKLKYF